MIYALVRIYDDDDHHITIAKTIIYSFRCTPGRQYLVKLKRETKKKVNQKHFFFFFNSVTYGVVTPEDVGNVSVICFNTTYLK